MAAAPRSPIDWTTLYLDSFRGIERVIRLTQGFVLLPVEAPGPDPGRALGEWLTAQGYPAVIHEPRDDKAWEEIAGTLYETEVAPNGVVLVLGGPVLPKGFYEGVWLLNQKRDPIVKKLARPLLWCGPHELLALMWERAPDLWSIRAVERRLEAASDDAVEKPPAPPRTSGPSYDADLDGQVVLVRTMLAMSAKSDSLQPAVALLLAGQLARADDLDEADGLLGEASARLEPKFAAEALILRASVARRQGELVAAREYLAQAEARVRSPTPNLSARLRLEQGIIALDEGNLEEAHEAINQALETSVNVDPPSIGLQAQLALAKLHLATRGPASAQRALAILDQIQARPAHFMSEGGAGADADVNVDILTTRARALAAAGDTIEALHTLLSSEQQILGALPPGGHTAALLVRLARTALDLGNRYVAEGVAVRALAMARTAGDVYAERHATEALDRARQPAQ
jgi:tetratricopeptide (TPR) repeat protein